MASPQHMHIQNYLASSAAASGVPSTMSPPLYIPQYQISQAMITQQGTAWLHSKTPPDIKHPNGSSLV